MAESRAAIEKRRYRKNRKKRIKAEADYKKKKADDPEFKKKQAARQQVHRDRVAGKLKAPSKTCPKCGSKMSRAEYHHKSYKGGGGRGQGEWRCPKCNPRGGAA